MKSVVFDPRTSYQDKIFDIVVLVLLGVIFLSVLYPLYFVVIASISGADFVNRGEVYVLPKAPSLGAYQLVFRDPRIMLGYKNSIYYTVMHTALSVCVTVAAAFSLSRREMVGYKFFTWFFLLTMYFNGGLIPTYLVVRSVGLVGTRAAIVILGCVGIWNVLICRTYFQNTIPQELWDACSVDGANMFQFFFRVVLPNSKAIIAIMVLYYAVAEWNQFFKGLIYLNKMEMYPLQLILRDILLVNQSVMVEADPEILGELTKQADVIKYAVIIVASVPVLMLYPFVQQYFVKGVMIGSVKG